MQQAITGTKEPILASVGNNIDQLLCPDCESPVYLRRRSGWVDHFCHKPNAVCQTKLTISRESFEHELGKGLLVERLRNLFPDAKIQIKPEH